MKKLIQTFKFIFEAPYFKMLQWFVFKAFTVNLVSPSPAPTQSDPNPTPVTLTEPSTPLCSSGLVSDWFVNCVASSIPTFYASGYESFWNGNSLSIISTKALPVSCPNEA